ncbi:FAD-binding oxidoreductase [Streptomyces sp. TRM64462]|uniref:FAD-binding oxidoreductase n=1 Tax=Streptomyces sp. TRM64462 TaxID=2741726 RepID=UPI001586CAF9|nr:FAD-dependent oxidoreductase [Streptomyces sp. TRM64462]
MLNRRNFIRAGGAAAAAGAFAGYGTAVSFGAAKSAYDSLRGSLQGDLLLPTDSGYDLAKQMQIAQYDAVSPEAIAYCETPQDVSRVIRFAGAEGLSVRTRSGGHNYSGWSTGDGIVVDVSRIRHATPNGTTVRLGPGAQSILAIDALQPYGKQIATGTCPTVCPGGFFLGGGIGYQTRKFGTGSDRVAAATVVLADGSVVRASSSSDAALYWGLRGGGGGNFGVVVDYEVRPVDAPRMVYYEQWWDYDRAADVFGAWQRWMENGSDSLAGQFVLLMPDAAPGTKPMVLVTGGYLGPQAELDAALAQFASLAGAQPQSSVTADLSYADAMKRVYHCDQFTINQCQRAGTNPDAQLGRTGHQRESYRFFNRVMTPSEIGAVLDAFEADRAAGHTRILHTMALGGALGRTSRYASAFWHRDAQYVMGFVDQMATSTPSAQDVTHADTWTGNGGRVIDPFSSGAYVNFTSSELPNWQTKYYGGNYRMLTAIKNAYDPTDFFRHPRSIGS